VTHEHLLRALADGKPHSGEELARELGVTRAAVWKQVAKLGDYGLEIIATPGTGYRLARRIELLDPAALQRALHASTQACLTRLDVFTEIDSTNRYLLEAQGPRAGELHACLAEFQTAGRGRRGRRWLTPLGAGLCLSASWQFADTPRDLPALALAVGVVARRALARAAEIDVALKWPNDLVLDERKLGGILVELRAEAHGGCLVVAGIGLNVHLPAAALRALSDWPRGAVDLASTAGGIPPSRIALAAAIIDGMAELFTGYATAGFAPYREDWSAADYLKGRRVTVDEASGALDGTACGIEADGALLVETSPGARRRVISGDVSVRSR
jgi:BirA family biotin operon repressor/biotin-[acetyl-CoA-carboxylase] ligase